MFAQNKLKLLLVVLLVTTLFELEVSGAAVNKTDIETNKHGIETGHPLEAVPKAVEKRNPKEDSEYMRFQQFQQLLDDEGGAESTFGAPNVLLMTGLISYFVYFMGFF